MTLLMNIIVYTETDSLAIDQELPTSLIGDELGQFKLEFIADEAYFISNYIIINYETNKVIIKAITLGGETLTKQDFIDMSYGINIKKYRQTFISIKDCSVKLNNIYIELNPILRKRYPIYSKITGLLKTRPLNVYGILEEFKININTKLIKI